jgi:hypothetical protein
MTEPPFDLARAHRWFAVECNNLAWELVEAPNRSPEDVERMLHAAHAAYFHWRQVGTLLNHLRAECLLATAYAVAGLAEPAGRHAERCLALSVQAGDEQTLFDRATAHGAAAKAYALAGRPQEASAHQRRAAEAAVHLDDPNDRRVFEALYGIDSPI